MLKLHKYQNLDAHCALAPCEQSPLDPLSCVCPEENQLAFFDLLHSLKCGSDSIKIQGSCFELIVADFLRYDKKYQDLYIKVQLFDEWAAEHPELAHSLRDTGIDVVATNRMDYDTIREKLAYAGQTYTAFQCKFYGSDTVISKADIDSFCNASDKIFITDRYIVTTNYAFSANAIHSFEDKAVPVKFITTTDLANSSIDWRAYKLSAASNIVSVKRALRPYQQEAVQKVIEGFASSNRGKLIMACGTGKTFVALNVADSLSSDDVFVLVLVPSISLLSQFLTEWKHYAPCPLTAFAVCSDSSVGMSCDDQQLSSISELSYPATTNPLELSRRLKAHFKALNTASKPVYSHGDCSSENSLIYLTPSSGATLSSTHKALVESDVRFMGERLIESPKDTPLALDPALPNFTDFAYCNSSGAAPFQKAHNSGAGAFTSLTLRGYSELKVLHATSSNSRYADSSLVPELSMSTYFAELVQLSMGSFAACNLQSLGNLLLATPVLGTTKTDATSHEFSQAKACGSDINLAHTKVAASNHQPPSYVANDLIIAKTSPGSGSSSVLEQNSHSKLDVSYHSGVPVEFSVSLDLVPSLLHLAKQETACNYSSALDFSFALKYEDINHSIEISSSCCSGTGAFLCSYSNFYPQVIPCSGILELSTYTQESQPFVPVQLLAASPQYCLGGDFPVTALRKSSKTSGANLNFAPTLCSEHCAVSAFIIDAGLTRSDRASFSLEPVSFVRHAWQQEWRSDDSWGFGCESNLQDIRYSFKDILMFGSGGVSILEQNYDSKFDSGGQSAYANLESVVSNQEPQASATVVSLDTTANWSSLAPYSLGNAALTDSYYSVSSGSNLNFVSILCSEPYSDSASSTDDGFIFPSLVSYPLDPVPSLSPSGRQEHLPNWSYTPLSKMETVSVSEVGLKLPINHPPKFDAYTNLDCVGSHQENLASAPMHSLTMGGSLTTDFLSSDSKCNHRSGSNLNFAPISCSEPYSGSASSTDDGFIFPSLASYPLDPVSISATPSKSEIKLKIPTRQHHVTVVISTYQSIRVVATAQQHYGVPEFDLIICDEAHRTTGCFDLSDCRVKHAFSANPLATSQPSSSHSSTTTSAFGSAFPSSFVPHAFVKCEPSLSEASQSQPPLYPQDAPSPSRTSVVQDKLVEQGAMGAIESATTGEKLNFVEGKKLSLNDSSSAAVGSSSASANASSTFADCSFSAFTAVHQDSFVRAKRRLFMTATQKVFVEDQRSNKYEVFSMDNPDLYGPCFYSLGFEKAVELGCLVDYKVLVLGIDPKLMPLFDQLSEVDQANCAKVVGTCKALSKFGVLNVDDDPDPMRRAVCFAQVIDSDDPRKVSSKKLARYFKQIIAEYAHLVKIQALTGDSNSAIAQEYAFFQKHAPNFECRHIDGNMSALQKNSLLEWMRAPLPHCESRLLFNVRCLSEGVDLPALDAIVFLSARRSIVEVLQALGRVMRKAPGKKFGYVILPVIIRDQECPDETFDRYPEFKVVWQVLNALKSFYPDKEMVDSRLNKLDSHIQIACLRSPLIPRKVQALSSASADATEGNLSRRSSPFVELSEDGSVRSLVSEQNVLAIAESIKAFIVRHQGNRRTWLVWAGIVAQIFQEQVQLLSLQITQHPKLQQLFDSFQHDMSNTLRIPLSSQAVIEMLSQHIVVRPILVELFKGFPFTAHNPIAKAMDQMIVALEQEGLIKATQELQSFYDSVATRMQDVKTLEDRQIVILDLFDSFFKQAFPKLQEKLGIVYTPVEVVDFMNNSVNDLLQREFGQSLAAPQVHVLDPFAGMGTFIARMMLDPKLLPNSAVERKYIQELHAFEVMPIAYYIASINIEAVYAERMHQSPEQYVPNRIMVLTDTFADLHDLEVGATLQDADLEINQQRREQVESQPLWVILGNPPYSVGQTSQNDDNPNLNYPSLDARISETYVSQVSSQSNKTSLYDTYLKAFRWASDHLGEQGIVAFVSNAGWIDSAVASGVRRCLCSEFSSIYIFHLKGNQRTAGEQCLKEGGKVFGDGCRAPVAITIFVKKPLSQEQGKIYFASVDDYLSREAKLAVLSELKSIVNVPLVELSQDEHGDWLDHRRDDFAKFLPLLSKHPESELTLFSLFSRGITTGRDAWAFNASAQKLRANFTQCITFYNEQVERSIQLGQSFVKDNDATKIKWDDSLISRLQQKKLCAPFVASHIVTALYRPFVKEKLYFDLTWITRRYQVLRLFPCAEAQNLVISVQGQRAKSVFSCLMTDCISSSGLIDNDQLLPRYVYTPLDEFLSRESNLGLSKSQLLKVNGMSVFTTTTPTSMTTSSNLGTSFDGISHLLDGEVVINGYVREDAITPQALAYFKLAYAEHADKIDADSVFYYVYGLLHSEDFRREFATNLQKEYVKIPRVATFADFTKFEQAGRYLAQLHVNYEQVEPYAGCILKIYPMSDFKVTHMRYGKLAGKGNAAKDKTTIIYNDHISIHNIPIAAQDYVVNRLSALDWLIKLCGVTTDKASGIVNDYNQYSEEVGDERYILNLILRVITVSCESVKTIKSLPKLSIHPLDMTD